MLLTPTGRVVLAMIRHGRRTGYEIKQLADVSTRFFWAVSYGQIYPELKRLEEQALIAGEASPNGNRQRTAYTLTPAGERALDEWLTSPGELGHELRDEAMLRLFFSDPLPPEQRLDLVRRMRARHESRVEELEAICERTKGMTAEMPRVVLDMGLNYHRAIAQWCEETEERMRSGRAVREAKRR